MAKSFQIAVIQFPGINTEVETVREIRRAGMRAEAVRWNESAKKISQYDGYVIGGGFAYEDRVRAGIIAALDPIMDVIKKEAAKGKPVLGICNGAQILVESGLIPGITGEQLAMALAKNKRVKDGKVLGTGFYNTWTKMKCVSDRSLFTHNIAVGEIIDAPIAHGEGRFTTEIQELLTQLEENGQMVFRYCDEKGVMSFQYPTNPNGAAFNLAAICNPEGNVMAIMPHLERAPKASKKLFEGMKDGMIARAEGAKKRTPKLALKPLNIESIEYKAAAKSIQFKISLMITDNTAETVELTLKNLGFENFKIRRYSHIEVGYNGKPDLKKLSKQLIKCGVLLNTNKECADVLGAGIPANKIKPTETEQNFSFLVRDREDFVGTAHLATLQNRLKIKDITSVDVGTLWEISIDSKSKTVAEQTIKKLMQTNIFANPHSQILMSV